MAWTAPLLDTGTDLGKRLGEANEGTLHGTHTYSHRGQKQEVHAG
jgi:hypothetical protein